MYEQHNGFYFYANLPENCVKFQGIKLPFMMGDYFAHCTIAKATDGRKYVVDIHRSKNNPFIHHFGFVAKEFADHDPKLVGIHHSASFEAQIHEIKGRIVGEKKTISVRPMKKMRVRADNLMDLCMYGQVLFQETQRDLIDEILLIPEGDTEMFIALDSAVHVSCIGDRVEKSKIQYGTI